MTTTHRYNIPQTEPIIHVGILAARQILFELKGNFRAEGLELQSGTYLAVTENESVFCLLHRREMVWPISTGSQKIELIPEEPSSTFILKDVTIGIGFHWEQKEDQEFEGGLILLPEGKNVRAINSVPVESYLKSVISSEMSAMNDPNLLNAHAIVSRSWLLAQIQNKTKHKLPPFTQTATEIVKWYDREDHDTFDVCADDHCQRYQGITKVISDNAQKSIEITRGQVLMFEEEICDARFSKCCGGITEDFKNVWQPVEVPYLVAIRDGFENQIFCDTSDPNILSQVLIDFDQKTTNFYRWKNEYSQQEISTIIHKKSGIDFGKIIDLIPLERGESGRIIRLKIIGSKLKLVVGKELEIRKWLSESHLFSAAFEVEKEYANHDVVPIKFIFHGSGWGHGVGMCQIGAAVMSRLNYSSSKILEHYFKGAKLRKIY